MVFASCQSRKNVDEINTLLDNWHRAAAKADMKGYFEFMADDFVFIGTDSSEIWSKKEFQTWAEPYFKRGKAWSLKATSRRVSFNTKGKMAWFDELLFTGAGTWRGSGVLTKEHHQWKLRQYVLSVTLPNEKMKEFNAL